MTISFRRVVCSKASVTIRLSASITLSMYATRFTFTNFALDIFGFVRFVREESMLLDRYSTRACDLFFIIQSEALPSLPWEKKQLLTCLMSVPPPKRGLRGKEGIMQHWTLLCLVNVISGMKRFIVFFRFKSTIPYIDVWRLDGKH